jgi:hypothetical protein
MSAIVRPGEVISIPADADRIALGQVVEMYEEDAFFLAVFAGTEERDTDFTQDFLDQRVAGDIELLALTFDARIVSGDWKVVGRTSASRTDVLPVYLVEEDDEWVVEDAVGTRTLSASARDRETLTFRTLVTPQIVEDAVQSLDASGSLASIFGSLQVSPPADRSEARFQD